MFTLLVGCPPFWHRKQMVMLRNIMEGKYSFTSPEWADISGIQFFIYCNKYRHLIFFFWKFAEDPKDLIRKCLVVEPEKRITVKEALQHPFFQTTVSTSIYYIQLYNETLFFSNHKFSTKSQCKYYLFKICLSVKTWFDFVFFYFFYIVII